jgi:hypothetical protein
MVAAVKSSARPKLVSGGGYDSPARAALAIAIAEKAAADEAHRRLVAAGETLERAVYAADAVVEAARSAIDEAREATVAHLTATATGTAGKAPKTVKQARQELADAEEALALARAARDGLQGRVEEAKATAGAMVDRVRSAAKAVLGESQIAAGLLPELALLQREFIAKGRALSWLMSQGVLPGDASGVRQKGDPLRDAWRMKQFVDMLPVDYAVAADATHAPAWQAALEALMQDPAAPLPGGDR